MKNWHAYFIIMAILEVAYAIRLHLPIQSLAGEIAGVIAAMVTLFFAFAGVNAWRKNE